MERIKKPLRNRNIIFAKGLAMLPRDIANIAALGNSIYSLFGFSEGVPAKVVKYKDCTEISQTGGAFLALLPRYGKLFRLKYRRSITQKGMRLVQEWLSELDYEKITERFGELHEDYGNICERLKEAEASA
jgi:hypothetical protein